MFLYFINALFQSLIASSATPNKLCSLICGQVELTYARGIRDSLKFIDMREKKEVKS